MSKQTGPKLYAVELKIIKFFILFQLEKINFMFFKSKKFNYCKKSKLIDQLYFIRSHD